VFPTFGKAKRAKPTGFAGFPKCGKKNREKGKAFMPRPAAVFRSP
jgi:hypothetical protein